MIPEYRLIGPVSYALNIELGEHGSGNNLDIHMSPSFFHMFLNEMKPIKFPFKFTNTFTYNSAKVVLNEQLPRGFEIRQHDNGIL